ncbi:MAG: hypothetical protein ABID38_05900 [Candidatus Diapherotrites archaeon]
MEKKKLLVALQRMRDESKQRKFPQSVDFTINFRGIDFKKAENRIDVDVTMPHNVGKDSNAKVAIFVRDKQFAHQLKGKAEKIIMEDDIPNMKKKDVEELVRDYAGLLAEGSAILTVGKYLGQQLAPKGKMPKPITTSVAAFESAVSKMSTSVKITNKKGRFMPLIHILVGKESNSDEELSENIMTVYNAVEAGLPSRKHNVKSTIVKLTMGPPIKVGEAPKAGVEKAGEKKEGVKEGAKKGAKEDAKEGAEKK